MIRAFIAIPLSSDLQIYLGSLPQIWSEIVPDRAVRWVKPHLMHITLRFLGNIECDSLLKVAKIQDEISTRFEPFSLLLDRTGCFPNKKRPRVVWVGLQGQLSHAKRLKQEIDYALVPLGWEHDGRPFRPHLTIGRIKDSGKVRGIKWEAEVDPLLVPVNEIQIIESKLHPSGPVYTVRHKSILTN